VVRVGVTVVVLIAGWSGAAVAANHSGEFGGELHGLDVGVSVARVRGGFRAEEADNDEDNKCEDNQGSRETKVEDEIRGVFRWKGINSINGCFFSVDRSGKTCHELEDA